MRKGDLIFRLASLGGFAGQGVRAVRADHCALLLASHDCAHSQSGSSWGCRSQISGILAVSPAQGLASSKQVLSGRINRCLRRPSCAL